VALSVAFRRPGVTWQSALWSSDFPRCRPKTGTATVRLTAHFRLEDSRPRPDRAPRAGTRRFASRHAATLEARAPAWPGV